MKLFSEFIIIFILSILNIKQCSSYRILGIFPLCVKSHVSMMQQLMIGLSNRGHRVDVVSQYPLKKKNENYTDIVLEKMPDYQSHINYSTIEKYKNLNSILHGFTTIRGNALCEIRFADTKLQQIIQKRPKYDLVIVEVFNANCFMAFGYHLNAPVVGVASNPGYPWVHALVGNPQNSAISSNLLRSSINPTTYLSRLYNTIHTFYVNNYFNYYTSAQTDIIKKYFGPDAPSVRELEKNISLVIVNSHLASDGVKPSTPAFIKVGGIHIQNYGANESLGEFQQWLDESENGFIYFAFGSMTQLETFPTDVIQALFKSFEKINPIRVLMKLSEPEKLPFSLPNNTHTFSWISQLAVLKHKNIKAATIHGGAKGIQETIMCGVPLIGVPLFADQFFNVDFPVKSQMAVKIDLSDLNEKSMDNALYEVLNNPIYRESAKKMSKKFNDRPMSPMDTACYWIEYIIRNGGDALRSPAVDLYWWEVALIDVYGLIFIPFIFLIVLFIYTIAISFSKSTNIQDEELETPNLILNNGIESIEANMIQTTTTTKKQTKKKSGLTTNKVSRYDESLNIAIDTLKSVCEQKSMTNEFLIFGQHVAAQLENLPSGKSIILQEKIKSLLIKARFEVIGASTGNLTKIMHDETNNGL